MSRNSGSSKSSKSGLGGAKAPPGIAGAAKSLTKAVSKGKAKTTAPTTGFQGATVTSRERMKPTTPIIGGNRDEKTNFATINKDRMKGTIKKTGISGL